MRASQTLSLMPHCAAGRLTCAFLLSAQCEIVSGRWKSLDEAALIKHEEELLVDASRDYLLRLSVLLSSGFAPFSFSLSLFAAFAFLSISPSLWFSSTLLHSEHFKARRNSEHKQKQHILFLRLIFMAVSADKRTVKNSLQLLWIIHITVIVDAWQQSVAEAHLIQSLH